MCRRARGGALGLGRATPMRRLGGVREAAWSALDCRPAPECGAPRTVRHGVTADGARDGPNEAERPRIRVRARDLVAGCG